jgi:hypothetical protein
MIDNWATSGKPLEKGDIVRLKSDFHQSFESLAARRAGLPLRENCLYQILRLDRGDVSIVLTLTEVRIFHLGGIKHIAKIGFETFPYISERFELVYSARDPMGS